MFVEPIKTAETRFALSSPVFVSKSNKTAVMEPSVLAEHTADTKNKSQFSLLNFFFSWCLIDVVVVHFSRHFGYMYL